MPASGLGEIKPGFLLDILVFGGQNALATGSITVNGTGTAYSNSFPLRRGVTYAWDIQFTSVGSVNVKVELEQGNVRPTTEGSADTVNFVVPDNKSTAMFTAITDSLLHNTAYSPNATAFGRLKFTGIAGNNAATQCTLARAYAIRNN